MSNPYAIADTSAIFSPGLIFFADLIRKNLARAIELAGSPARLRPHVKTHKTREIVRLELEAGIGKHKVATLAEAEMVASCGATDVLIAYPIVGPNCERLAKLIHAYPGTHFSILADHPASVEALSAVLSEQGQAVDVLLDLDVGQHRTGIAPGPEAVALYELIDRLPGLTLGGLHVYDGHNHIENFVERQSTALAQLEPALKLAPRWSRKAFPRRGWWSAARPPSPCTPVWTCPAWSVLRARWCCTITATDRATPI